jgi:hypothetical protein
MPCAQTALVNSLAAPFNIMTDTTDLTGKLLIAMPDMGDPF